MTRYSALPLPVGLALLASGLVACGEDGPNTRPLTSSERALVSHANDFGFDLLKEIAPTSGDDNCFVSPLSVSMALGMTYNGARNDTEVGMRDALGYGTMSAAEISGAYRGLIDLLVGMDPSVTLTIANSIWYREGFTVEPAFITTNQDSFDAEVSALDFSAASAPGTINDWVKTETNGRIDSIVDQIDPDAIMYLIDAIYFKGTWSSEFDPAKTHDATFETQAGVQKTVRMMSQGAEFPHASRPGYTALALPYGFGLFQMTILLPDPGHTVDEVAAGLDAGAWADLQAAMTTSELDVSIPRFELEYERSLVDVLSAMGMQVAFNAGADFSGINPDADLYIDEVLHKTFVRVDEEGTEAAAATSVGVNEVSLPPSFVVDRPFLFLIHDQHSGAILFAGKITDPPPAS